MIIMVEFLLSAVLTCSESEDLIQDIMKGQDSVLNKHELIEVIKQHTKLECYEGSEHNS